jgi:hypothetical protein
MGTGNNMVSMVEFPFWGQWWLVNWPIGKHQTNDREGEHSYKLLVRKGPSEDTTCQRRPEWQGVAAYEKSSEKNHQCKGIGGRKRHGGSGATVAG